MTYKWHLTFSDCVPKQLSKMDRAHVRCVFVSLADLLSSDNPLSRTDVIKIANSRLWRQRAGKYRILFTIESETVIVLTTEYKGTIHVVGVLHRKDAYR